MRPITWTKRGLIISPGGAPAWRAAHSGMVSVLPWEDGYRMFLTGRAESGGYRIGWLDLDAVLRLRHEHPANPVLPAGRTGCFDSLGMCMPCVVRVDDATLYMYYAGWAPTAPGMIQNEGGLAVSRDNGATWARWSEAPLPLRDGRDPIGIGTIFVLRDAADAWRMWYTTFREWRQLPDGGLRHYYHIKYAESEDGIYWRKPAENLAIDFVGEEYALGRPMVVREAEGYRMWFCTRAVGDCYRIGYAESRDGLAWERKPPGIDPAPEGWDAEMVEYAYVLKEDGRYLMFYNGNGYGASGTGLAEGEVTN
ncbi:MAG: glycoside hydrolase family protein [Armatimonadota bacterium]